MAQPAREVATDDVKQDAGPPCDVPDESLTKGAVHSRYRRRLALRLLFAAAAAIVFPVLTVLTIKAPSIRPTQVLLDASDSSSSIRAVLEADMQHLWFGFHGIDLMDMICHVYVDCDEVERCSALSTHLTEVQKTESHHVAFTFEIDGMSPVLLEQGVRGLRGADMSCEAHVSFNIWHTGLRVARTFDSKMEDVHDGISDVPRLVRTAYNVLHPQRKYLNTTVVLDYTVEWSLPPSGLSHFLLTTPVRVKANAGVIETRQRSMHGFAGIDSFILVDEKPDGGIVARLPLQATVDASLPAVIGLFSSAAINTVNGVYALPDGEGETDIVAVELSMDSSFAQIFGKEHLLTVHSTRSLRRRLAPDSQGRLLQDANAVHQTHRIDMDGRGLLAIDLSLIHGDAFEARVSLFELLSDASERWSVDASAAMDSDMIELMISARLPEEVKAGFTLDWNQPALKLKLGTDTIDVDVTLDEAIYYASLVDGSTNVTARMDPAAEKGAIGIKLEGFDLQGAMDIPARTFSAQGGSENFEVTATGSLGMIGGNNDGSASVTVSIADMGLTASYRRTGHGTPYDNITLSVGMDEQLSADPTRTSLPQATFSAAMEAGVELAMRTEEAATSSTTFGAPAVFMTPKCQQVGHNIFNAMCDWSDRGEPESCCRDSMAISLSMGNTIGESMRISSPEFRMVTQAASDDWTLTGALDPTDAETPRLTVEYTYSGDIHSLAVDVDETAAKPMGTGTIAWQNTADVLSLAVAFSDADGTEMVDGNVAWRVVDGRDTIGGSVTASGSSLGSITFTAEDLAGVQHLGLNVTMEDMLTANVALELGEERLAANVRLLNSNDVQMLGLDASVDGALFGGFTVSCTADLSADVAGEAIHADLSAATLAPLLELDIDVRYGREEIANAHLQATHPSVVLDNRGANRELYMAAPFAASGWADTSLINDDGPNALRLADLAWSASDTDGNLSSRLAVTNGSDVYLLWTFSFDDTTTVNVMDVLSDLTLDGEHVAGLTAALSKSGNYMAGELVLSTEEGSESVYANVSRGFLPVESRPTGFDQLDIALGTVIDDDRVNASLYVERGPDTAVSGIGYTVAIYNGPGASATLMYEGTGHLVLIPGELEVDGKFQSETTAIFAFQLSDLSDYDTSSFVDVVIAQTNMPAENVIVESVVAEVKSTYAVDEGVTPEQLKSSVARAMGVPKSQVTVRAEDRRLMDGSRRLAANYDVTVRFTDLDAAKKVVDTPQAALLGKVASELAMAAPDASAPVMVAAPSVEIVVTTKILSESRTPPDMPEISADAWSAGIPGILAVATRTTTTRTTTTGPDASVLARTTSEAWKHSCRGSFAVVALGLMCLFGV